MSFDLGKSSSDLKRADTPTDKKHAEMGIIENDSVSRLVAWGGAFTFACLFVASMFKRRKKIISLERRRRDNDSNLDASDFGESKMEGLQLLLQSSTHNSFMPHRGLRMEPILEKNEDDKFMVIVDETTWQAEWTDESSSSSLSSEEEYLSSWGVLLENIERDDSHDIVIYREEEEA